jgi:two-component system sensor histidine kinase RegB
MEHFGEHLRGMWVAFGVAACFIVYFVHRVTRALAEREAELADARKLASLATLAAGAAHELSTPLGTIAVVSKELERRLTENGSENDSAADARLIRSQVGRCRGILDQLAADAGDGDYEPARSITARKLITAAIDGLAGDDRVQVHIEKMSDHATVSGPPRLLTVALRAVIENAIQASPSASPVRVDLAQIDNSLYIQVHDAGTGAPPEVLARAGEPFFTTKGPGQGMGLGLFLTRTVLDRVGGRMELASRAGEGTRATIVIPIESLAMQT